MTKITRQELESRYASEEKIGVYTECPITGARLTDEDLTPDTDSMAMLPNGTPFGICTNSADFVVKDLKQGAVYGFMVEDNPVEHAELREGDGHDFAVIRGRFIVDLWISHYTGCETQIVYDMKDPKDADKIKEIFGSPERWSVLTPDGFIKPDDAKYPPNKRLKAWAPVEETLGLG
jgi:hypothetical protein